MDHGQNHVIGFKNATHEVTKLPGKEFHLADLIDDNHHILLESVLQAWSDDGFEAIHIDSISPDAMDPSVIDMGQDAVFSFERTNEEALSFSLLPDFFGVESTGFFFEFFDDVFDDGCLSHPRSSREKYLRHGTHFRTSSRGEYEICDSKYEADKMLYLTFHIP